MTKYLSDTNVVSELRKPNPYGAGVAWIVGLRDDQLYIFGSHDWRIAERN